MDGAQQTMGGKRERRGMASVWPQRELSHGGGGMLCAHVVLPAHESESQCMPVRAALHPAGD